MTSAMFGRHRAGDHHLTWWAVLLAAGAFLAVVLVP